MNTKPYLISFIIVLLSLYGCKTPENAPKTVSNVDIERYSGLWYEIALFPNRFEKGCECTTAEYRQTEKGYIRVINRCYKKEKWTVTKGKAFPVEGSKNTKLRVQFFWPFRGDYWIIDLAPDYSWAVVSEPGREYLWILSRTPELNDKTYQHIIQLLEKKEFDTSKLAKTPQYCQE